MPDDSPLPYIDTYQVWVERRTGKVVEARVSLKEHHDTVVYKTSDDEAPNRMPLSDFLCFFRLILEDPPPAHLAHPKIGEMWAHRETNDTAVILEVAPDSILASIASRLRVIRSADFNLKRWRKLERATAFNLIQKNFLPDG